VRGDRAMKQLEAIVVGELSERPVPELRGYAVVARWALDGRWKLFPELFSCEVEARDMARDLSPGWAHRTIISIRVPGRA